MLAALIQRMLNPGPPGERFETIEMIRDRDKGQFQLVADFNPQGDQPQAIEQLVRGLGQGEKHQVLLGVTGSGKTFSMANVIEKVQKPTLIISHNKTLAGQLAQEFRSVFPGNAVEYFVSYYDYYQPEAYMPGSDTYIEKETDINEEIEKLRLSATTMLATRKDVIVVANIILRFKNLPLLTDEYIQIVK